MYYEIMGKQYCGAVVFFTFVNFEKSKTHSYNNV